MRVRLLNSESSKCSIHGQRSSGASYQKLENAGRVRITPQTPIVSNHEVGLYQDILNEASATEYMVAVQFMGGENLTGMDRMDRIKKET